METTLDKLLNGRVCVEQPKKGFRIAVDTIFLAAAVPARAGELALDLGCGVGGAMLALACRCPGVCITGLDIQEPLVNLARANIARNGWDDRLLAVHGDSTALPVQWAERFDHVLCNPPYHDGKTHLASANPSKRLANTMPEEADVKAWIESAARVLKPGGVFTMIHRADKGPDIAALAGAFFQDIRILPIAPHPGGPARRMIVQAWRGQGGADPCVVRTLPPFVLYGPSSRWTPEAELILREAAPVDIFREI